VTLSAGDTTVAAAVIMAQFRVTLEDAPSTTLIEKELVPAVVGVPVTPPVEAFKLRPAGSDPVNENVYGVVPPVAPNAELKGTPT